MSKPTIQGNTIVIGDKTFTITDGVADANITLDRAQGNAIIRTSTALETVEYVLKMLEKFGDQYPKYTKSTAIMYDWLALFFNEGKKRFDGQIDEVIAQLDTNGNDLIAIGYDVIVDSDTGKIMFEKIIKE